MPFDFYQRMHDEKEIYSERGVSVWQIYSYVSIRKDGRIKKDNDYTVWCVWKSVKSEIRSWNVKMKTGKKMPYVKETVKASNDRFWMVKNCGIENEKIYENPDDVPEKSSYYSLIVIKEGS